MTVNAGNVMVGLATLWVAPWTAGAAEPAPADTITLGSDWAGNWTSPGATDQGVTMNFSPKTNDIMIEEQITPAEVTFDMADISVEVSLAEDVLANIKLAMGDGGTITVTAPGTTQVGKSQLALANSLSFLSVGFEGVNTFGFWRRLYIPKVLSVADVKTTYRRAKAARLYPLKLRAICDPSQVLITDMTANHT